MRKIHTKSRRGCKQCKARRIKCDEAHPSCGKCVRDGSRCSFLAIKPVLPALPLPRWHSLQPAVQPPVPGRVDGRRGSTNSAAVRHASTLSVAHLEPEPEPEPELVSAPAPVAALAAVPESGPPRLHQVPVSMLGSSGPASIAKRDGPLHQRLLHYLQHDFYEDVQAQHPGFRDVLDVFVETAFTNPYLMDELLAYAAAHKSVSDRDVREIYLTEATRLQTRALVAYNSTAREVREDTCLPMFIFSSLLSHHHLFMASVNTQNDLGTLIDRLTGSIEMHRGLCTIAKASWPMFSEDLQEMFKRTCKREPAPAEPVVRISYEWSEALASRLAEADLSDSSRATLLEVVHTLRDRYNTLDLDDNHDTWTAVQDFLISIPASYVRLLDQRRPEALVVLAHFAVLIHHAAGHWFVGDLGKRLIYLINHHLGPYYTIWLEWPNKMLA
ncbi:hypothetical protein BX600DRAFT_518421 [Xylariales sp. PMI_506]|nr:hypothetical protein BX600DRAFT_518421 [Xylariales sp. PMI_506]